MEKKGLSRKQLLLFIGSIVMLVVVFVYFIFQGNKQQTDSQVTTVKTITPRGAYPLTGEQKLNASGFVQYTSAHYKTVYPSGWNTYSYKLPDGNVVFLAKAGPKPDENVPAFQIAEKIGNGSDSTKAFEYTLYMQRYGFTSRAIPLDGDVVDEIYGMQTTKNPHIKIFKHIAIFSKNGREYNMAFSYASTGVRNDYEAIYAMILEHLSFTP